MKKQHVALTRCFYCGEPDKILLASRYRQDGEPVHDLGPMDGKVVDREPCSKCADLMSRGILFIGVRDGESGDNPYRTGQFIVVKDEAVKRVVNPGPTLDAVLKGRFAFVDESSLKMLGLIDDEGRLTEMVTGKKNSEKNGEEDQDGKQPTDVP